ncbi:MAG: protein translocase subunit SecF [Candidatus Schekmanbacteria bacterium]|nr:protein translocase subunit SecF [Candidatus Schekmanbacteria bacterium]
MEIFKPNININFVGRINLWIGISIVTVIISISSLVYHKGLNPGIDFAGGTLVEVHFNNNNASINDVRDAISAVGLATSGIQQSGEGNVLIKTELSESGKISDRIKSALNDKFGKGSFRIERVEMVGPATGADLRLKAQTALLFSIIGMIIYISYRFQNRITIPIISVALVTWFLSTVNWIPVTTLCIISLVATLAACIWFDLRQAFGSIIALIHDVIVAVGALSLTGREFSLTTLAAILTIIGYSMNDTIVVYDRIRENLNKRKDIPLGELINRSINETLSRTILTSGLTLLTIVALYIYGGPVINDFSFALLVGIVTGTYSSIYVASSTLVIWDRIAGSSKKNKKK